MKLLFASAARLGTRYRMNVLAIAVGFLGVASSQPANCTWSGPHLHYGRSTNYGTNAKNGAAGFGALNSWVGADEVTFVASAP